MRYQGPPQSQGSSASLRPPPGLGWPLPPPPPPPPPPSYSSHHRRRVKQPPHLPPPHPSLITTYTARYEVPPLVPALLPNPSSCVHNHQASGLHVLPLKCNRQCRSKKVPSYGQYGIPDDILVKCYYTVLMTKGTDLELNLLCGAYYRDILKYFNICARENKVLAPCFFSQHACFAVYGEPGHYMVKLNSVQGDRSRHVEHPEATSGGDAPPRSGSAAVPSSSSNVHSTARDQKPSVTSSLNEESEVMSREVGAGAVTASFSALSETFLETTDASLTQPKTTGASVNLDTAISISPEVTDVSVTIVGPSSMLLETTDASLTQPKTTGASINLNDATGVLPEVTDTSVTVAVVGQSSTRLETTNASPTQYEANPATMNQRAITDVQTETAGALPTTSGPLPESTDAEVETWYDATDVQPEANDAGPKPQRIQPEACDSELKPQSGATDVQPEASDSELKPQSDATDVKPEATGLQYESTDAELEQANLTPEPADTLEVC